jgi:hypothetical protein
VGSRAAAPALADDGAPNDRGRIAIGRRPELRETGLELVDEGVHGREAVARVLLQSALDGVGDARRDVGPQLEHVRRLLGHMPHCHGNEVLALERNVARQQLEEHDAERVDVGGGVHRPAARLLGRDVVARPEHGPGLRHALDVERSRDAEVGHLRLAVAVQQHVLRLDVAVNEPGRVREGESATDLRRHLERLPNGQRAAALDHLLQVLAGDVLEDDELAVVVLAAVDDGNDARVRELRHGARLAAEALDRLLVGEVRRVQDLQRDVALEQGIVRAVDARHPSGANELEQLVAAG